MSLRPIASGTPNGCRALRQSILALARLGTALALFAHGPAAAIDDPVEPRATPDEAAEPSTAAAAGFRHWLEERGMQLEGFVLADLSQNFRGGLETGRTVLRSLVEISWTLDLEPLFGISGGTLFVDVQSLNGRHGTELLVGDLQGFSNLDSEEFTALYELWYEQVHGRLRWKVGKIDASNEFAFVDGGAEMLNSSAGFSPTVLGFPTYPNPASGGLFFVAQPQGLFLGAGLFDGATQAGFPTGTRGPSTLFGRPSDLFGVLEVGTRKPSRSGKQRRLAFGLTHHTGEFERFDRPGTLESGATSYYLVLDQGLVHRRRHAPRADDIESAGIDGYLQIGNAAGRLSPVDFHAGAGLAWRGYIPRRPHDRFGASASWVHLSGPARPSADTDSYELACELFYRARLTSNLWLQPDLQLIVHPSGRLADAVVGTLRLEIAF